LQKEETASAQARREDAHNEDKTPIFEDIVFYVENLDKGWFGFMYPDALDGWSHDFSHAYHMSLSIKGRESGRNRTCIPLGTQFVCLNSHLTVKYTRNTRNWTREREREEEEEEEEEEEVSIMRLTIRF
jgi:hypothetical protein